MIRKLLCFFHICHEQDLWLADFVKPMYDHINSNVEKGWACWIKVPYDKFGLAYYTTCKHCGRRT